MEEPAGWELFGWQGISMEVPADWCPGALGCDYANGYARVEDEFRIRLELRWESLGSRLRPAAELVDRYLREVERKARRRFGRPNVERHLEIRRLEELDHEAFIWRGGILAHSLVAVCAETRRMVHVRIFFSEDDELRGLTRRVFGSLRTAPCDGLNDWSVFGFHFRLPAFWRLEKSAVEAFRPQFLFGSEGNELEVARWNLADVRLRKVSLRQWFEGHYAQALQRFRCEVRTEDYRGHPAVRCDGVVRAGARPFGMFRRPRFLRALAWHCEPTNKVFVLRANLADPKDPQPQACAGTIRCHEPSPA